MDVIIIDFQGFKDEKNNFIVKELALGGFFAGKLISPTRYLFEAPYNFRHLPRRIQISNQWLTRNFHGLDWNDGNIRYERLVDILLLETEKYSVIACKGLEKAQFLMWLLNREVVNLDEMIGRRLCDLPAADVGCYHGNKCAVENVVRISGWMKKILLMFESSIFDDAKSDQSEIPARQWENLPDRVKSDDELASSLIPEMVTADSFVGEEEKGFPFDSRWSQNLPQIKEEDAEEDEDWMLAETIEDGELLLDDSVSV